MAWLPNQRRMETVMITEVNRQIVGSGVLGIIIGAFWAIGRPCNSQNKPGNSQKRGFGNIGERAK